MLVAQQTRLHKSAFINVRNGGFPSSSYDTVRSPRGFKLESETARGPVASYGVKGAWSTYDT